MKVLGAGTAIGAFGGVAAADEHDAESTNDESEYPDDDDVPIEELTEGTVHVVRTLLGESTDPNRPLDFYYQPTGLHIEPGDVIKFVFETPDHTVTSYHPAFGMQRRIPSGVQPFSSPILGWDPHSLPADIDMPPMENDAPEETYGDPDADNETGTDNENDDAVNDDAVDEPVDPRPSSWLYAFETPGVYDLECAPHEAFGMAIRVVVGEETETAFETSSPEELPPPRVGPVGLSRQVLTDPNLEPESIVEEGRVEWMDLEANQKPDNDDFPENGDDAENGDE